MVSKRVRNTLSNKVIEQLAILTQYITNIGFLRSVKSPIVQYATLIYVCGDIHNRTE